MFVQYTLYRVYSSISSEMPFLPLPFQKLLFRLSRLLKALVKMGSISDHVYLLGRDEAETARYVFI